MEVKTWVDKRWGNEGKKFVINAIKRVFSKMQNKKFATTVCMKNLDIKEFKTK